MNTETLIYHYLECAEYYARMSTCTDKQVGCVLLDYEQNVLSRGHNHVLTEGTCNICLGPLGRRGHVPCPAVHAEMAALMAFVHYGFNTVMPYIAICTLEPCIECTKALVLAGVRKIYYDKPTNPRKSGKSIFESLISNENGRWERIPERNTSDSTVPSDNGPAA